MDMGGVFGGNIFCVEEYKKLEFEVMVEVLMDLIVFGEIFLVKVKVDYYFGVFVMDVMVKFKVMWESYD